MTHDQRRPTLRNGANPAVVAALALAMVSLALAGAQPARMTARHLDARTTFAEADASRLVAAALAAAKDLLGVAPAADVLIAPSHDWINISAADQVAHLEDSEPGLPSSQSLRIEHLDLPPPTC